MAIQERDLPARSSRAEGYGMAVPFYSKWHDEYCATLASLADYIDRWGRNQTVRDVAQALCAHFDAALWRHREEQEARQFPQLRIDHANDLKRVDPLIFQWIAGHLALDKAWETVRMQLCGVMDGRLTQLPAGIVTGFCMLYQNHIREERECLARFAARETPERASSRAMEQAAARVLELTLNAWRVSSQTAPQPGPKKDRCREPLVQFQQTGEQTNAFLSPESWVAAAH